MALLMTPADLNSLAILREENPGRNITNVGVDGRIGD
jgi:hypothetical protein